MGGKGVSHRSPPLGVGGMGVPPPAGLGMVGRDRGTQLRAQP